MLVLANELGHHLVYKKVWSSPSTMILSHYYLLSHSKPFVSSSYLHHQGCSRHPKYKRNAVVNWRVKEVTYDRCMGEALSLGSESTTWPQRGDPGDFSQADHRIHRSSTRTWSFAVLAGSCAWDSSNSCRKIHRENKQFFFCLGYNQWPFQDPKLEVPTIYKAYVRPM